MEPDLALSWNRAQPGLAGWELEGPGLCTGSTNCGWGQVGAWGGAVDCCEVQAGGMGAGRGRSRGLLEKRRFWSNPAGGAPGCTCECEGR